MKKEQNSELDKALDELANVLVDKILANGKISKVIDMITKKVTALEQNVATLDVNSLTEQINKKLVEFL